MKPAAFRYHAPDTLDEALHLLAEHGDDAKPLAGGQSLIPAMNFRLATPSMLVDLNRIAGLDQVANGTSGLQIGAMVRHRTLERSRTVSQHAPLVSAAMPHVAHAAIRTRGTIGGSLAHADPAAELPAVMLALNATFTLASSHGHRTVPADRFFGGLFATALKPGELLVGIDIPGVPARSACAFDEVSRRRGDFALAGVAAVVALDANGTCTHARIGLLSLADRPVPASAAERSLVGSRPTAESIRAAAEASAHADIDPTSDIHASIRYRRQLAAVLIRRVLERAFHSLENA